MVLAQSPRLKLYLGIHEGKLRFFTPDGMLISIPEEELRVERKERQSAEQRAAEATSRATEAEALLAKYRKRFGELL